VKSLLCGHVAGAFPGAGARIGAFTQARDGVCFLDESHGVMGPVMEVLDGGRWTTTSTCRSARPPSRSSIVRCCSRPTAAGSTCLNSVNIDEFTRLGAATLKVPELAQREEDMIAVTASILDKLADGCTSWKAPAGLTDEAWELVKACRWHGNARALLRTMEAAFVDFASRGGDGRLIPAEDVEAGLNLWEPKDHHSHKVYGVVNQ